MEKGRLVLENLTKEGKKKILNKLEDAFADILDALGAPDNDLNFRDTPNRCARALLDDFIADDFEISEFEEEPFDGMITWPSHTVWTRCPHHLERVGIRVCASYIPRSSRVVGLSKPIRLMDYLAKGCILQETYTRLLADEIMDHLEPEGCGVHTEARHQCMQCRGVRTHSPVRMTILRGSFAYSRSIKEEFLRNV